MTGSRWMVTTMMSSKCLLHLSNSRTTTIHPMEDCKRSKPITRESRGLLEMVFPLATTQFIHRCKALAMPQGPRLLQHTVAQPTIRTSIEGTTNREPQIRSKMRMIKEKR